MACKIPYFVKGVINMSFFKISPPKNINEKYFKSIQKIQQSPEYQENEKQIKCITKMLVEHADVPREIIEILIESVQENVALEYESSK